MSSDSTYGSPSGGHPSTIEYAENALINGVSGKKVFVVGSDGNQINFPTLVTSPFDYIAITYPTTSSEVYTYKTGGSGGTTVATVTLVYTDTTKEYLLSVAKT